MITCSIFLAEDPPTEKQWVILLIVANLLAMDPPTEAVNDFIAGTRDSSLMEILSSSIFFSAVLVCSLHHSFKSLLVQCPQTLDNYLSVGCFHVLFVGYSGNFQRVLKMVSLSWMEMSRLNVACRVFLYFITSFNLIHPSPCLALDLEGSISMYLWIS